MDEQVEFTKNNRLIDKDISHIGGSIKDRKLLIMSKEEEYIARKAFEHQADIDDAFGI